MEGKSNYVPPTLRAKTIVIDNTEDRSIANEIIIYEP